MMNDSQWKNDSDCSVVVQLPLSNLPPILVRPFTCIFVALAICATLFNSIAFILYFKKKQLRQKRSAKLLLSLATSDLLVGVLVAPISIAQTLTQIKSKCHFINTVARGSHIIMVLTLMIMCTITLEFYLKVVKHNIYQKVLTPCRFKALNFAPWIFSTLILVTGKFSMLAWVWIVNAFCLFIFLTIYIIYWKIHVYLKNRGRFWRTGEHSETLIQIHKQNKKSTRTILLIVVGVTFCSITAYTSMIIHLLNQYQIGEIPWLQIWRKYYLGILGNILQQSNSIVNPILYFCRSTDFSKALKGVSLGSRNSSVVSRSEGFQGHRRGRSVNTGTDVSIPYRSKLSTIFEDMEPQNK